MGTDIHTIAEKKSANGYIADDFQPFDWRSYGMFAFLANVRNYSAIPPLSEPRGLPEDASEKAAAECGDLDRYGVSWLSVSELLAFDYNQPMEDRRVTRQTAEGYWSGGETCDPGEGLKTTFRDFLGDAFFHDLAELERRGVDRVVFCFDC